MAINVKEEVFINCNQKEVAEIMFNPNLDKSWVRELKAVYPMSLGLYKKDAKIERVGDFLNRRYSAKLLVTKFEENRFVEFYADEPFEMKMRYELIDSDGGTLVKLSISSFGEILYNSPISIVSKKLSENVKDSLKRLKKKLESSE